jgi:hypothetical protein
MKVLAVVLLMVVLSIGANLAMAADPPDVHAHAEVECTVDGIMEWALAADFATIEIPNITDQATKRSNFSSLVLYTNGNVHITADLATEPNNAQLKTGSGDTLVTEYKLEYDGAGVTATGGATVNWTDWTTFLGTGSLVTHVPLDGAVSVKLSAQAYNDASNVADAGLYEATQTLTASWGDPP